MQNFLFQINKESKAETDDAVFIFGPLNNNKIDEALEAYNLFVSLKGDSLSFSADIEYLHLGKRIATFKLNNLEHHSPLWERTNKYNMCVDFKGIALITEIDIIPPFKDKVLSFLESIANTFNIYKTSYLIDILLISKTYIKDATGIQIPSDYAEEFEFEGITYIGLENNPLFAWLPNGD